MKASYDVKTKKLTLISECDTEKEHLLEMSLEPYLIDHKTRVSSFENVKSVFEMGNTAKIDKLKAFVERMEESARNFADSYIHLK